MVRSFEELAAGGAGVGLSGFVAEGGVGVVAAADEIEVLRAVVSAVGVATTDDVAGRDGAEGSFGHEALFVVLAEVGQMVEDVAVGEVIVPAGIVVAHLLNDGAGIGIGVVEGGDERCILMGTAGGGGIGGHGSLLLAELGWLERPKARP